MRKITKLAPRQAGPIRRKRVAAYARVSSGKDAMLHSLSAQISYYNKYIGRRGDWAFAGIYADEALTGTKDSRPEFQRLLADCRAGKIDRVLTKSVTRFARNTVTLLETARELKLLGVDVFFEKENIHTLSADGELMLTLLASYAQEESRSASENQKWRIRRMFEQGRPNTGRMLGYRLFDGRLYIVPEEVEIVKQIFSDYLSGMGLNAIAKKLNKAGVPSKNGVRWRGSTLHTILRNEKYIGDMLLQKTYQLDHISKKTMINRGEKAMYYVENSHEAIVQKAVFMAVQQGIKQRANIYRHYPQNPSPQAPYLFSSMLQCGCCGKNYRRKIANAGGKYAKPVWICETFNVQGKAACPSQQIPESILIAKTVEVLGGEIPDRAAFQKRVLRIQIPAHNLLLYNFCDGRTAAVQWQNPSRRESWTPEMKEVARQRQTEISERRRQT